METAVERAKIGAHGEHSLTPDTGSPSSKKGSEMGEVALLVSTRNLPSILTRHQVPWALANGGRGTGRESKTLWQGDGAECTFKRPLGRGRALGTLCDPKKRDGIDSVAGVRVGSAVSRNSPCATVHPPRRGNPLGGNWTQAINGIVPGCIHLVRAIRTSLIFPIRTNQGADILRLCL